MCFVGGGMGAGWSWSDFFSNSLIFTGFLSRMSCECSGDQKFSVSLISWGIWTLGQLSRPLSSKLWQIFRSLLFYFSSVLSSHLKFKSHSVKYSQNLSNLFNSSSHFSASRLLYHRNISHTCDHPPLTPGYPRCQMSPITDLRLRPLSQDTHYTPAPASWPWKADPDPRTLKWIRFFTLPGISSMKRPGKL